MSNVEDGPISVWLQRDGEESLDHDYEFHYSKDRCTITCWVPDDLIQNTRNIFWKSCGSGQPSKIRVFTERAHALYHNNPCSESICKECEAIASKTDGRVLTVKVEVLMPSDKRPPLNASGSLPIKKDDKKKSQNEGGITNPSLVDTRRRYSTHPCHSALQPNPLPLFPSFEIPPPPVLSWNHILPPKLITFYFRARSRENLHSQVGSCSRSLLPQTQIHYPRAPVKPSTSNSRNQRSSGSEYDSSGSEDFPEIESYSPKSPIIILPHFGASGSRLPLSETRSTANQSRKSGNPKFKPYHVKPTVNHIRRIRLTPTEDNPAELSSLDSDCLGNDNPRDSSDQRHHECNRKEEAAELTTDEEQNRLREISEAQKKCFEWSTSLQV